MKVIVAPDSLKECLASPQAARAVARGVRRADPCAEVLCAPMADGGEGTLEALVEATGGELRCAEAADPLGRTVRAKWGICGDGRTAVVEMAEASGLDLLGPDEREPMRASTRGTGQLIAAALDAGARSLIVGIGGSATVDAGTGMAAALGARFLDADGREVRGCGGGRLAEVAAIDLDGLDPRIAGVEFVVACDVTNPLIGPDGAARTYAPQKGATPEQVEQLERGMRSLAEVIRRGLGVDVESLPGAGAAGGLGAGLVAFLGAEIRSGVETVMEAVGLREKMRGAELVLTAEGRADGQSAFGKVIAGVAGAARGQGVPVIALAGSLGQGWRDLYGCGVAAVVPILDRPMPEGEAIERAGELLEDAAERVVRIWQAARRTRDG